MPALRGVHVATLVSLFGALLFATLIVGRDAVHLRRVLFRLARISAACALLVGLAWLVMGSAVIADADNLATTLASLPVVTFRTAVKSPNRFVRLVAPIAICPRRRP